MTLVVEPELPEEALQAISELCGVGGRGPQLEIPLRWDSDELRRRPLEPDWAEGSGLCGVAVRRSVDHRLSAR